jgi:hypothetical protein
MNAELEKGSASIVVELSGGVITVTHGEDGETLFSSPVSVGTWDAVWTAIRMGKA